MFVMFVDTCSMDSDKIKAKHEVVFVEFCIVCVCDVLDYQTE